MSQNSVAAFAFDIGALDDATAITPSSAMVRGRDGRMRSVDVARLVWPDENATAGVDYMADLTRRGPLGRC
ncbi:MAG: hypothetical protein ACKVH0_05460 [Alphaproteobacteria bacterium]|jgi:hypothetical protein